MLYCVTYLLVLMEGDGRWSPQVSQLTLLGRSGTDLHEEGPSRCIWKDDKRVGKGSRCGVLGGQGRSQVIERPIVPSFGHCLIGCGESLVEAKLEESCDERLPLRAAWRLGWRGRVTAGGSLLPESGCGSGAGFQEDAYVLKLKWMLSPVW